MDYALIKNGIVEGVIVADADFVAGIASEWDHIEPASGGVGPGWAWTAQGGFVRPESQPEPEPTAPVWAWYIDIGPFFDRFGPTKMAVLTSADAGVRALITDLQVRKWVDLKLAEVAQGLAYIGTVVPSVTPALQQTILTTPVLETENLALRKLYFS